MNNTNDMNINRQTAQEKSGLSRRTKTGSYTFVISAVVLAAIVIINLIIAALPRSITVFDTSTNRLYTISDSTKKYLSSLTDEVAINWVCPGGSEDPSLGSFLKRYADISPKLKINTLDPIKNPDVLDKYLGDNALGGSDSSSSISDFSIIVESSRRFMVVDSKTLFSYYNEMISSDPVSYDVYAAYQNYFLSAESAGYETKRYFNGEDIITKAVEYVSLERIPQIYFLVGHGEAPFSDTMLDALEKTNIEHGSLNLLESGEIPADAACIVINAPSYTDLSDSEAELIKNYLKKGGNLLLITSPDNVKMKNLMGLTEPYGVLAVPGVVLETNAGRYYREPYILIPSINKKHDITSNLQNLSAIMPQSHGIMIEDDTSEADVTALFTTSSSSYSLNGEEKTDPGTLALGVAITAKTESDTTQIIWYSSSAAFTDDVANSVSIGNYYYLFNSILWLNEGYESALTDISGVLLNEPRLSGITASSLLIWGSAFVLIVPVAFLSTGLFRWIKRKRR